MTEARLISIPRNGGRHFGNVVLKEGHFSLDRDHFLLRDDPRDGSHS